jgi:VWFA-related protein
MVAPGRLRFAVSVFLLLCSGLVLAADKAKPKPETSVREEARVTVVEVPVNVIDRDGQPVEGLSAEDFEVYDDGKKQAVSGFDVVDERHAIPTPAPGEPPIHPAARRHFLIVFDLSFSSPKGIVNARRAARDFVVTRMKDLDLAAVATFSVETGMKLLVTFTGDRTQLASAIDTLGFATLSERSPDPLSMLIIAPSQSNASGFAYLPSSGMSSGTVNLSDSILQDALETMQVLRGRELRAIYRNRVSRLLDSFAQMAMALDAVKGRKHILYLSEGFDSRELIGSTLQGGGSIEGEWVVRGESWKLDSDTRFGNSVLRTNMETALALFNRSDCVIHAIDIAGLRALSDPSGSMEATLNGQDSLFSFAHETGGEFLKNANDLGNSFDRLLERTGLIYVLAFQLMRVPETGKFHTLKVRVKGNSSYRISARSGYYEAKPYSKFSPIEKKLVASSALAAAVPKTDIPAWVLASPFPNGTDSARVPIVVEIPGDRLLAKNEGPQLTVDLFLYAVDQKHETKDYLFHSVSLDLTKLRERLRKTGLKYYGEMNLPSGDYTLRVLVRNNATGQFGVSVTPLTVPASVDAFTSPPLFMDEGREWIMVRGKGRGAPGQAGPYPFAFGADAFVPAASPNIKSGDARQICLIAHHFEGELAEMQYTGRILGEDGRPHGRAELQLVRASNEDREGERKFLLQFRPSGLDPGRYALAVKLLDSKSGRFSESSFHFDVQ